MKRILACTLALLLTLTLGCGRSAAPDYTAQELFDAVKAAYGESFLPDADIPEEMLTETFGLDMADVAEYAAQMPTIGFHPDRVIVVKAVSGKGEAVKAAFETAKQTMVEQGVFYPANLPKINTAQILQNGDYVAFLLVGAADDVSETEEDALAFAKSETQKGVDAWNAMFA